MPFDRPPPDPPPDPAADPPDPPAPARCAPDPARCAPKGAQRPQPRTHRDVRLQAVFHRQHNVASRAHVLAAGGTPDLIKARLAGGAWVAVHRAVYRPAWAPLTDHGRLLAAVLACGEGALASHDAAAWLWGLADEPGEVVTVFGTRSPRPRGVSVVRSKLPAQPSERSGIPCTNPLRTMLDLAVNGSEGALVRAFDRGVAARLFSPEALTAELDRWAGVRRPGLGRRRRVLTDCGAVSMRSPSVLQNVFARLLARAGLPMPVAELPVLAGRYRLDFAYPEAMLAFELDGREHHEGWQAAERDHARRRILAHLGWTVLVYTAVDVWRRPEAVVDEVRAELVSRGVPGARCEATAGGGRRRPRRTPRPDRESPGAERAPPCG
jgi:hypothetical protein